MSVKIENEKPKFVEERSDEGSTFGALQYDLLAAVCEKNIGDG